MIFSKFDGAGNDFVIVDAREDDPGLTAEAIAHVCHRRKGVGADGLMLLTPAQGDYDFVMRYYNSDGLPADMCGNGGRCITVFAHLLGLGRVLNGEKHIRFLATDGPHEATLLDWDNQRGQGTVRLGMRDVPRHTLHRVLQGWWLNTGVPHYVQQVTDLSHYDVLGEGRRLRHHPELGAEGANVNFVERVGDCLHVRTYERGVEDETWACGTGVTACAIALGVTHLSTRGGDFLVEYQSTQEAFTHVELTGPVSFNFKGEITFP